MDNMDNFDGLINAALKNGVTPILYGKYQDYDESDSINWLFLLAVDDENKRRILGNLDKGESSEINAMCFDGRDYGHVGGRISPDSVEFVKRYRKMHNGNIEYKGILTGDVYKGMWKTLQNNDRGPFILSQNPETIISARL